MNYYTIHNGRPFIETVAHYISHNQYKNIIVPNEQCAARLSRLTQAINIFSFTQIVEQFLNHSENYMQLIALYKSILAMQFHDHSFCKKYAFDRAQELLSAIDELHLYHIDNIKDIENYDKYWYDIAVNLQRILQHHNAHNPNMIHALTGQTVCAGVIDHSAFGCKFIKTTSKTIIFPHIDGNIADIVEKTHPQYEIKLMLAKLGLQRENISELNAQHTESLHFIRTALCQNHEIMHWHRITSLDAPDNIKIIECKLQEVETILHIIAENRDKNIALITNNSILAHNVAILLQQRFDIIPYHKTPLIYHPASLLFLYTIDVVMHNFKSIKLLTLLRHPWVNFGYTWEEYTRIISLLELNVMRNFRAEDGLFGLISSAKSNAQDALPILTQIQEIFARFNMLYQNEEENFNTLLQSHIECVEKLAPGSLKRAPETQDFIKKLHNTDIYSIKLYKKIWHDLLLQGHFHTGTQHNIHILHPDDAYLLKFDMVILGSFHSWTEYLPKNSWLSNEMRKSLGLIDNEILSGRYANKFTFFAHNNAVIITYLANKTSNILSRINILLQILDQNSIRAPEQSTFTRSQHITTQKPPIKRYSFAMISALMRNPDSLHTAHNSTREIDPQPSYLEFSIFIHKVLAYHAHNNYDNTISYSEELLNQYQNYHNIIQQWRAKLEKILAIYAIIHQERSAFINRIEIEKQLEWQIPELDIVIYGDPRSH